MHLSLCVLTCNNREINYKPNVFFRLCSFSLCVTELFHTMMGSIKGFNIRRGISPDIVYHVRTEQQTDSYRKASASREE